MKRIFICILIALCLLSVACKKEPDAVFETGVQEPNTATQTTPGTEQPGEGQGEQQPAGQPSGTPTHQPQEPQGSQQPQEPQEHAHLFENGGCTGCSEVVYTLLSNGNIAFGSYPQSEVTDAALVAALSAKAGTLPTDTEAGEWCAFEGESNSWYVDIEHEGERYRGLYFTAYRPERCNDTSPAATQTAQYQNGYRTGTVYWFQYEPLEFRVLRSSQGKALLACVSIVDAQIFHTTQQATTVEGVTYYANNYAQSALRDFLNGVFAQTAFRNIEYSRIEKCTVDNSAATTASPQVNPYACENTEDGIFLLSYADISNTAYGFSSNATLADGARQYAASDYAKARGLSVNGGYSSWWLRSPHKDYPYGAYFVGESGKAQDNSTVYLKGVLSALQITL